MTLSHSFCKQSFIGVTIFLAFFVVDQLVSSVKHCNNADNKSYVAVFDHRNNKYMACSADGMWPQCPESFKCLPVHDEEAKATNNDESKDHGCCVEISSIGCAGWMPKYKPQLSESAYQICNPSAQKNGCNESEKCHQLTKKAGGDIKDTNSKTLFGCCVETSL